MNSRELDTVLIRINKAEKKIAVLEEGFLQLHASVEKLENQVMGLDAFISVVCKRIDIIDEQIEKQHREFRYMCIEMLGDDLKLRKAEHE